MPRPGGLAAGDFDADPAVLDLMRKLGSAFVATWCWASDRTPTMRPPGEHHLEIVRRRWRDCERARWRPRPRRPGRRRERR